MQIRQFSTCISARLRAPPSDPDILGQVNWLCNSVGQRSSNILASHSPWGSQTNKLGAGRVAAKESRGGSGDASAKSRQGCSNRAAGGGLRWAAPTTAHQLHLIQRAQRAVATIHAVVPAMSAPGSGQQGSSTRHRGTANGSILSFFQPIPNDDRSTRQSAPNAHYKLSRSPPSSPPIGHIKAAPEPVKTEIAASDDEVDGSDGDRSDDSLEDLSCLLGRPKGSLPARQPSQHDPLATPKAKRTAVEFHSSPLAIMPRHKFDFKALAKDARRDFATTASSLKIKPGGTYITESKDGVAVPSSESVAKLLVQDGDGHDGQDAQKLLRAVKRSEPSHGLPRYCFFEQAYEMPPPAAAPKLPKNSPWLLLTEGNLNTKEQHLVSGLPQTILRKCGGLPDELFEWILSSLCVHPSFIMRQEYSNMVTYCNEQTGRLITAERINTMFRLLGAKISNTGNSSLALSALDSDPYRDRDWSCLQTVLTLLGVVAPDLSVPSVETAARILVQLALDKFLISNAGLLAEYEFAMKQLLKALPSPSWDEFVSLIAS